MRRALGGAPAASEGLGRDGVMYLAARNDVPRRRRSGGTDLDSLCSRSLRFDLSPAFVSVSIDLDLDRKNRSNRHRVSETQAMQNDSSKLRPLNPSSASWPPAPCSEQSIPPCSPACRHLQRRQRRFPWRR